MDNSMIEAYEASQVYQRADAKPALKPTTVLWINNLSWMALGMVLVVGWLIW